MKNHDFNINALILIISDFKLEKNKEGKEL